MNVEHLRKALPLWIEHGEIKLERCRAEVKSWEEHIAKWRRLLDEIENDRGG